MGNEFKSWGRQRAFRRPQQSYAFRGLQAHVTVCLDTPKDSLGSRERTLLKEVILDAHEDARWSCLVLCVMPDHFHLLLQTNSENISLPQILAYIKRCFTKKSGRSERFQRSYQDHLVRSKEPIVNHARYILMNPVKAGLVESWDEWDATWYDPGAIW